MNSDVDDADHRPLDRHRAGEDGRDEIDHRGEPEKPAEERIDPAARERAAERHRRGLPVRLIRRVALVEHLQVAADALDAGMDREYAFEDARQGEQRQERRLGQRGQGRRADDERRPRRDAEDEDPHPVGAAFADGGAQGAVLFELTWCHVDATSGSDSNGR